MPTSSAGPPMTSLRAGLATRFASFAASTTAASTATAAAAPAATTSPIEHAAPQSLYETSSDSSSLRGRVGVRTSLRAAGRAILASATSFRGSSPSSTYNGASSEATERGALTSSSAPGGSNGPMDADHPSETGATQAAAAPSNSATLSGATDVVVVEHGDGTWMCTPFHVRFGRFKVRRVGAHGHPVAVVVNGRLVPYLMRVGNDGVAAWWRDPDGRVRTISDGDTFSTQQQAPGLARAASTTSSIQATLSVSGRRRAKLAAMLRRPLGSANTPPSSAVAASIDPGLLGTIAEVLVDAEAAAAATNSQGSTPAPSAPPSEPASPTTANLDVDSVPPPPPPPEATKAAAAATTTRNAHLMLSSSELAMLSLRPGANDIVYVTCPDFSLAGSAVDTATVTEIKLDHVPARIYLWPSTAAGRIVVSDIDGTVTRSDALGILLPAVFGVNYAHAGVASLYSSIASRGYRFLYLTSRGIGQAQATREYLARVRQDSRLAAAAAASANGGATSSTMAAMHGLPDGPVLTSPDGLLTALKRELVTRTPAEFKTATLGEIARLFSPPSSGSDPSSSFSSSPPGGSVFAAGFGNRSTDMVAYRVSGIPDSHAFLVDPAGALVAASGGAWWASLPPPPTTMPPSGIPASRGLNSGGISALTSTPSSTTTTTTTTTLTVSTSDPSKRRGSALSSLRPSTWGDGISIDGEESSDLDTTAAVVASYVTMIEHVHMVFPGGAEESVRGGVELVEIRHGSKGGDAS
ncbi:Lipin/Ned1/Smp2-domain-containing protein [Blastocladiella britannica]|nr:Lipin/Ned1/Smp2-domain-containing protein [Blastocladiella britannica]